MPKINIESRIRILTLRVVEVNGLIQVDRINHRIKNRSTQRFLTPKQAHLCIVRTTRADLLRYEKEE